ncbi:MAG: molybdopterin-dependent oxidoreductase [Deltaproteobacteria bacterium]|nr:molybdopterin-dependent oxidoreductase [Deltaproteobacteria bacterium]
MTRRFTIQVPLFDRRFLLKAGGLAVAGAASGVALPGCDTLSIPPPQDPGPLSGISDQSDFYIQSCCGTPDVDPATHTMEIIDSGTGDLLGSIDQAFVRAIEEPRLKEHTLQCIGSSPRFLFVDNAVWTGLPFVELLELAGIEVPEDAIEIVFFAADGYDTSIPISDLDAPIWLVWQMNGEELTAAHGAPFRFLVPGRYGTKNPKWVERLEFSPIAHIGYWERRNWSNEATYRPNALTLNPTAYAVFGEGGAVRVQGSAFAGLDAIAGVEWTRDDGVTWQQADITYSSENDHTWTLWSFEFTPEGVGDYYVRTRVTTESGAMSEDSADGTDRLGGFNGGMEIRVVVT